MNRFVAGRSQLFSVMICCIALALFADGINLDDLFPGNFVVHEEDEPSDATLPCDAIPPGQPDVQHRANDQNLSTPPQQGPTSSAGRLHIVFDQDSPFLESAPLGPGVRTSLFVADAQQVELHQFSSSAPLYLLLRVLLI